MRNLEPILTSWNFLNDVSPTLSSELQQLVQNQSVRLIDHTIVVRKNITGASSTFPVINATTKSIEGISTIDGAQLTKNQAVVFDQIALGYGLGDENQEGAVKYRNTDIAALRNASFVIKQNNREVLNLPVADLLRPTGNGLNASDQYYSLKGYAFLVDDEEMEWDIKFPAGVAMPAPTTGKFHYLEVFIKGAKTIKNIR